MSARPTALPGWEDREPEEWARWLGASAVELHRVLSSTNDRTRELAREGAAPFTVVVAGEQTAGRGRGGREWHSPPGAGLWMSVLLTGPRGGDPGVLPLAVGVAAAEAVEVVTGTEVDLKWPNDLFLKGRKLGGVLCETVSGAGGPAVAAGVGLNLRRPAGQVPQELERRAAFLEEAVGPVSPPRLARGLLVGLRRWAEPPPERLTGALGEAWRRRDLLDGRRVVCQAGAEGRARGVSDEGALLVEREGGGNVMVRAGGVRLVGWEEIQGHGEG